MMENKKIIQLIHALIFLGGIYLISFQSSTILIILGVIMIVPSLTFIVFLLMTLDFDFAKDHYKKIFRMPD